jgi:hypothetical protein
MLASFLGKQLLNGFLRNKNDISISLDIDDIYLGLLTQLPQNNEKAYPEGHFFKEPIDEPIKDTKYHRIKLTDENPFTETKYMAGAQSEVVKTSDGIDALSAYVHNQAIIMFEESTADWGNVVGFGIFKEASGQTLPVIWGAITDGEGNPVEVKAQEIPIIRKGSFKVSLV